LAWARQVIELLRCQKLQWMLLAGRGAAAQGQALFGGFLPEPALSYQIAHQVVEIEEAVGDGRGEGGHQELLSGNATASCKPKLHDEAISVAAATLIAYSGRQSTSS